jgi:outer membrane autotransporter protein
MAALLDVLDNLDDAGIASALNALIPVVDNSALQVSNSSFDKFISTVISHLNGSTTGVSTGSDMLKGVDVWAQGYGSYLHEDQRGLSNGYNATLWGTALGFDLPALTDSLRLGLCGGFGQDFVRSKDNSGHNDINNYQATLYGNYNKDAYYIGAALAFAINTYDATRHVSFLGFDTTPKADYNGQQYMAYIEGGYTVKYKNLGITPLASFQYSNLHIDKYSEKNGGGADLNVKAQDYNLAQTGFGAKLDYPLSTKYGTLIPEFRFKWLYDWVGDSQQSTSSFTGGGASFATNGFNPAQSSFDIGTKLTLLTKNNVSVSVNYDLQLQDDLYGHYGYAEAKYSF